MKPLIALSLLALAAATQVQAAPAATEHCFRSNDIRNHTVGDPSTLYLKVGMKDVYRLTMVSACLSGAMPSDPIITKTSSGSNLICRPIDLTLSIGKGHGFSTPCIVQSMTKLTKEEVAALPKKQQP